MKLPFLPQIPFLLLLTLAPSSPAEASARCYRFTLLNLPNRESRPAPRRETWCYQRLSGSSAGSLYVYNADHGKVRPELAAVRTKDGVITHGSLLAGALTMHSVRDQGLNPLPVPLEEPRGLPSVRPAQPVALEGSARKTLAQLLLARSPAPASVSVPDAPLSESASIQPWRGYWWPYQDMPMVGPLAKYEAFVRARAGSVPDAVSWERARHRYQGVWWEGHCNGWAASAILRPEPGAIRVDDQSGTSFSVSDLKGVLAEQDYCADAVMYGHRHDGEGKNPRPVQPAEFHRVLTYYIGTLHKPVVINYRDDAVIDNHVISGYSMELKKSGRRALTVTATLRVHQYDGEIVETAGIAPAYKRTYRYSLRTDGAGAPVSGSWLGDNPGFLWVPLGSGTCSQGNPHLTESYVTELLGGGSR